jgi:quinol monooxygenase YgiN
MRTHFPQNIVPQTRLTLKGAPQESPLNFRVFWYILQTTPIIQKERNMVKVLMERTIRGQNVGHYLVISAWESLGQWQDWFNNPERQKLSAEIDSYLESPTRTRVMTN